MVDMDRAIPNQRGEPCYKHCWVVVCTSFADS